MNLPRIVNISTRIFTKRQNYARICTQGVQKMYDKRNISTIETGKEIHKDSLIKRVIKKIPLFNPDRTRIMAAGYILYEGVADGINYMEFFEELQLPDTFYSWFVITELHIWMISVRGMAEGDDGRLLRNSLVEALWRDVNQRVKKLGASNPSVARGQVAELAEQLQAALIAYDEGLQSDDTVLAGALWRRFYQQEDVDPNCLDLLVKYIRRQIRLLDHLSTEQLLLNKEINWEPLKK